MSTTTTTRPDPSTGLVRGIARSTGAELLRLRKWPATWITLGAWLALSILFGYLFPYLSYTTGDNSFADEGATAAELLERMLPPALPEVFLQGMPMFGGALMLVLGAMVAGNGYGWGTWKTMFSSGVRRGAGLGGSIAALTVLVVATLLASLVLDFGLSLLVAATESQEVVMPAGTEVLEATGIGLLVLQMWAVLGFLIATVARGPALAVGLGLVWSLVVENLLRGVGSLLDPVQSLTTLLPGTAAGSLVGSFVGVEPGGGTPGVLDTVAGDRAAVTVAAYVVLAVIASLAIVRRRDVT